MNYDTRSPWQRVLDQSIKKSVGNKKYELLPLFCNDTVLADDITTVIRHFVFGDKIMLFHFASLFCFSDKYDRPTSFFQIFYNDILKTNEAVWRVDDKEFFSFKESLVYYLAKQFCKKRNLDLEKEVKQHDAISSSELKIIFNDDGVLSFIEKFNQIDFLEILRALTNYNHYDFLDIKNLEQRIGQLFFLLSDSRKILEPYIKNSEFLKFFPHKARSKEDLQDSLRFSLEAMRDIILLRNYLIRMINNNIDKNQELDCFVEKDKKFYKVLCIRDSSPDAILHSKYLHIDLDVKSSNDDLFLRHLWVVKDVKSKIYFPEVEPRIVFNKAIDRFNSYLSRNVDFLDENLGEEGQISDAKLHVSKESLLKFLEPKQEINVEVELDKKSIAIKSLKKNNNKPQNILKPQKKPKQKRSPLAFTKMAKAIKNNHVDKEVMWEYLFAMAKQDNADFRDRHSFTSFKIQDKKILWSTDNTKGDGETMSKRQFFKKYPSY